MEGIFNPKYSGDQINDEAKTSEESYKGGVDGEIDSGRERREWRSDSTKVECVIWCGRIPFCHLVVGVVGLIVTGVWGGSEVWRRQSRRLWPDTSWHSK